jgi:hypothetical protein
MLRVPIRIGDGSAHIAASWSVVIVARRVVRAAETIPAASGHTKARVVIFCVVAFAIANLESGFVAVIVVVEAHLGGSGIELETRGGNSRESRERAKQTVNYDVGQKLRGRCPSLDIDSRT